MKWFSYEVDLVDPKTNEESTVTVQLTEFQRAAAMRSPDLMAAVQDLARPLLPLGFMPIGRRVRGVS